MFFSDDIGIGGNGIKKYSDKNHQDVKMNGKPNGSQVLMGREIQYSDNNFTFTLSNNGPTDNYRSSTAVVPKMEFGQTEWTRLWANKCFQRTSTTAEITNFGSNPATTSSSISVSAHHHQDLQHWNLPGRPQQGTIPSRVVRLSCWENEGTGRGKKIPVKNNTRIDGDPLRRFNEVKIRRDRSTYFQNNNKTRKFFKPSKSTFGVGFKTEQEVIVRRAPPRDISTDSVKQKSNAETGPREWEKRLLRKVRFEQNLDLTARANPGTKF